MIKKNTKIYFNMIKKNTKRDFNMINLLKL